MEVISNLLQAAVTLLGFFLGGIRYLKSRKQEYFLLTCFYGCFFLGSLYWTMYLLLFSKTPQVFYVSEFGWVASVIFLSMLQYTLSPLQSALVRYDDHCFLFFYPGTCLCQKAEGNCK